MRTGVTPAEIGREARKGVPTGRVVLRSWL